jgi:hypothetical protein
LRVSWWTFSTVPQRSHSAARGAWANAPAAQKAKAANANGFMDFCIGLFFNG